MKTALIIHGHFYQPPRENPKTGIVENQASAAPYKNWNEAIYQTCYKPNAYARYLNSKGKILLIKNNYEYISSNFGPTLLNWMDDNHPDFIKKLIEADNKSLDTLGHSNFIAQCYNHTILPLDPVEVKRIEISWALQDYKKRFGHDSEGFWCSECAIDCETIDVLAESGVKFVILSPWQATAINNKPLNGKPAPSDRAFNIYGKKHSLAAFFYDPDLASGISFGHYLTDADRLYNHLRELRASSKNPALISCATDGEIYGHHEAFGDMALAALLKKVEDGNDFYITNYGAFLEKNPPKDEATLFNGDKHPGSSWSCCHGVERWCSNCGCHTGGPDTWNQKWRAPLRVALANLEIKVRELLSSRFSLILGSSAPYDVFTDIMKSYGSFIVGSTSLEGFFSTLENSFNKTLLDSDKKSLAILLDSYRSILFSFTSCGWFFNDISGLEPRQNIIYALNAIEMLKPFSNLNLLQSFLYDLSFAKSNIPSEGTGEVIAKQCLEDKPGSVFAAFFFIKNSLDIHYEKFRASFGIFKLISISDCEIAIENSSTMETAKFSYSVHHNQEKSMSISVKDYASGVSYYESYSPDSLVLDNLTGIIDIITLSFGNDIGAHGLDDSKARLLMSLLDNLRSNGFEPDLSMLQNVVYPYITNKIDSGISEELRNVLIEKLNFAYEVY